MTADSVQTAEFSGQDAEAIKRFGKYMAFKKPAA
jgi:hypothetical protein